MQSGKPSKSPQKAISRTKVKYQAVPQTLFLRTIAIVIALTCAALAGQSSGGAATTPRTSFDRLANEARAAKADHRVDDAIRLYKQALRIKPSWDEGWWDLGMLNYELDHYQDGRDAFRHLTLTSPNVAVGWAMLGLCEFETRQYPESLLHLQKGIGLGLGQSEQIADVSAYHLAILLTRYQHYEDAMQVLASFSQHGKDGPDYVQAMGVAALRKPLLPAEVPPQEHELVMDVGRAMYDMTARRMSEADSEFKRLIEKYPAEPNIHYLFGTFLLYADADKGLEQFKQELAIDPDNVPTLVTMAGEYAHRQQYKQGLDYAKRAVEASRDNFAAHGVLGRILISGNLDIPLGIKELETARRLEPGSPQVRFFLSEGYAKVGRKEDSARERQEFLRLRKMVDDNTAAAETGRPVSELEGTAADTHAAPSQPQ